jgi:hypothetical protein
MSLAPGFTIHFTSFDNKNPTVILVPEQEWHWKGSLHLIFKFCRFVLYRCCHALFHWNVLCNDLILLILCRNPQCRLVCHLVVSPVQESRMQTCLSPCEKIQVSRRTHTCSLFNWPRDKTYCVLSEQMSLELLGFSLTRCVQCFQNSFTFQCRILDF